jgi:hypothetical protein
MSKILETLTGLLGKAKEASSKPATIVIAVIVVCVLACVGSFWAGRRTAPVETKYVEKQVIVEKEVIKTVEVEKKVDEKKKDEAVAKNVHKERTEVTHPDGTKEVKETVDVNATKVVKEVQIQYVDRIQTVEKVVEVEKKVEIEKVVKNPLPDWGVQARVGVDISAILNPTRGGPVVIGLEVDRRIIGPFKAGVWAQTNTTFNQWQAGLSVGAEF